MSSIIDCDQHLYEPRTLWRDYIDPALRHEALAIEDDDLGYAWLTWKGQQLDIADVQVPGEAARLGAHRQRHRRRRRAGYSYDDTLPARYWEPAARAGHLRSMGLDQAVLFPNFGLLWERRLSDSRDALTANMTAWNRWCATVVGDGAGRLHPVAHLTLRDEQWIERQLHELAAAGVRLAMIAPALVDGRPLSHPDHDRIWSAFVDHAITPIFHVADQARIFDDAWYRDSPGAFVPTIDAVFIWTPPALAMTDLIVNGVLDRHPDLRIGIVELSAIWVPGYLLMLDGGVDFTTRLNGEPPCALDLKPSEYFQRQVRVAAFSYEQPDRLRRQAGDLFMCCSDFPHAEGTESPVVDYQRVGAQPEQDSGLFRDNVRYLLRDP